MDGFIICGFLQRCHDQSSSACQEWFSGHEGVIVYQGKQSPLSSA